MSIQNAKVQVTYAEIVLQHGFHLCSLLSEGNTCLSYRLVHTSAPCNNFSAIEHIVVNLISDIAPLVATYCVFILFNFIPPLIKKGKAIPLQAWAGREGSRRLRLPDFKTIGIRRW